MARAMDKHHEMKKHEIKKMEHRAKGGAMPKGEKMPEDEQDKSVIEHEMQSRKRGGRVHGEKGKSRPDKRARGGATSDADPITSAGKMSKPSYEGYDAMNGAKGMGKDRD